MEQRGRDGGGSAGSQARQPERGTRQPADGQPLCSAHRKSLRAATAQSVRDRDAAAAPQLSVQPVSAGSADPASRAANDGSSGLHAAADVLSAAAPTAPYQDRDQTLHCPTAP